MTTTKGKHIAFRVDEATLARVEALQSLFTKPWRKPTRSETFRALLLEGIAVVEKRHLASGRPK
jgi:hypothetical protein